MIHGTLHNKDTSDQEAIIRNDHITNIDLIDPIRIWCEILSVETNRIVDQIQQTPNKVDCLEV